MEGGWGWDHLLPIHPYFHTFTRVEVIQTKNIVYQDSVYLIKFIHPSKKAKKRPKSESLKAKPLNLESEI